VVAGGDDTVDPGGWVLNCWGGPMIRFGRLNGDFGLRFLGFKVSLR
jgi:hypothetical protein